MIFTIAVSARCFIQIIKIIKIYFGRWMLCSKEQAFTFSITKLKKWAFHKINHNPFRFLYLSNMLSSEKPLTKNDAVGNVSSSLVSVKTRISMYRIIISFNCSNLFGSDFMLTFPITILFWFLIFSFWGLNNIFEDFSSMALSLAWSTKCDALFFLDREKIYLNLQWKIRFLVKHG